MATVLDVAAYILQRQGRMTSWKLQKLVYYSQAWHLVWEDKPLFEEEIEAWANGPVVRPLYQAHKGKFKVDSLSEGNPDNLNPDEGESVDAVLGFYGNMTSQELSDLTHREAPWKRARRGLDPGDRGYQVIGHDELVDYYSGVLAPK